MMFFKFLFGCVSTFLLLFVGSSKGCSELTGIGDDLGDIYTLDELSGVIPTNGNSIIPIVHLSSFLPQGCETSVFFSFETPMTARVPIYIFGAYYSILAAYEDNAFEWFAREDVSNDRRRCETTNNYNNSNTELFEIHRSVAFIYGIYYSILNYYPGQVDYVSNLMTNTYGLDINICDNGNCDGDILTPWGLAYSITNEIWEFSYYDGWNADGSYNKEYNRVNYSDWRDDDTFYIPENSPWKLKKSKKWQPLLETDFIGFLFYQEHVTPHIGYTGKSIVFSNEEFCDNSYVFKEEIGGPDYDYEEEIDLLFSRMSDLTDLQKMEIEYFDAKFNLGTLHGLYMRNGLGIDWDSFEYIKNIFIEFLTIYESVLAAWKEKVDYDRVRPPSIIQKLIPGELVTTYAGVDGNGFTYGTQELYARDWEPYIRTMPHAEYPSGSSCICSAFAKALFEIYGTDDITASALGSDGLTVTFAAKTSSKEPLSTPANDIVQHYTSWTQIADICAQSRLDGGMHFTDSVPDGVELCQHIGTRVAQTINSLANGQQPQFIVDINDLSYSERTCYPESKGNKSKSKSNSKSKSKSKSKSSED